MTTPTRDEIAQLIEENIEVTVSLERSVGVDGTKAAEAILARIAPPAQAAGKSDPFRFFSQNVDAWGALEWFDRLAKAIRQQDAAVVAGNMMEMETCRNVAASSAMRLVRDYEMEVRAALSREAPDAGVRRS